MAAVMDRAAILNIEWAEAPTENGEPDTAGTVFDASNLQDFARKPLATARRWGNKLGGSVRKLFDSWYGHDAFRKPL